MLPIFDFDCLQFAADFGTRDRFYYQPTLRSSIANQ